MSPCARLLPPKLCSPGSSVWDQEEVTRVVPMPPALTSTSRPGQPLPPTGFLHQDSHLPPPAQAGLGWERLQPPTGPVSVPGPSGEGGGPGRGCQSQHTGVCGHGLVWHLRAWFQPTGPGLSLSWVTQTSWPPALRLSQAARPVLVRTTSHPKPGQRLEN